MILINAVKGVDEAGAPDLTSQRLVNLIGQNCHRVVANDVLRGKYSDRMKELFGKPQFLVEAANFLLRILENSAKFEVESQSPPNLPTHARVPKEDVYVVQAALVSRPTVVTAERRLRDAINSQRELFGGLEALSPSEAVELAKDV